MRIARFKVPWPNTAGWFALAALLSAVLAVYAGRHYLQSKEAELRESLQAGLALRPVIVAARALGVGDVLKSVDLAVREVPVRYVGSDALSPAAAAQLVGKRLLVTRRSGDMLALRDIDAAERAVLSAHIETGMRAVTLPVDELGSLSGLLKAGDHVDLYYLPAVTGGEARIGLLLPHVLVLATGPVMRATAPAGIAQHVAGGYGSITVQLAPQDAERLALAQRVGQVVPVLRRTDDDSPGLVEMRTAGSLLRPAASAPTHRPPMAQVPVEFIIGGRGEAVAATDAKNLAAAGVQQGAKP